MSENIQQAKLAIMARVEYVKKTKAGDLPFSFASERAFIVKVRPEMQSEGITIAPVKAELLDTQLMATKQGKTMIDRCLGVTYRFTHGPSQTYEDVQVIAEACDTLDKAASKAMTQCLKYALRQWLLIETGDDPDRIQDVDAVALSTPAEAAYNAAQKATTRDDLNSIEKRIVASASIGKAESAWLIDFINNKREGMFSLDDVPSEA